jgi:hypothetical protein
MAHVGEIALPVFSMSGAAVRQASENARAVKTAPVGSPRAQAGVVKLGGGNWIPENDIDKVLRKLMIEEIPIVGEGDLRKPTMIGAMTWVRNNLRNYITKQMGSPNDPIRKLADEGVHHLSEDYVLYDRPASAMIEYRGSNHRADAAYLSTPKEKEAGIGDVLAKTELGKKWENLMDLGIDPSTVGRETQFAEVFNTELPEWAKREGVDPNTRVYRPQLSVNGSAEGFDILVRNIVSRLDRGELTPENIKNISVENVVRDIHSRFKEEEKARSALIENQHKAVATRDKELDTYFGPVDSSTGNVPVMYGGNYKYEDGSRWVMFDLDHISKHGEDKLKTDLSVDTVYLKHCVGAGNHDAGKHVPMMDIVTGKPNPKAIRHYNNYTYGVSVGEKEIVSLRGADGVPRVTIDLDPINKKVLQISGAENGQVLPEDVEKVKNFLASHPNYTSDKYESWNPHAP